MAKSLRNTMANLFGIDGLGDDLKEAGILIASGAGAVIVGDLAMKYVPVLKDFSPRAKALAAIGLGIGGGILVGRAGYRTVGTGIATGLATYGALKLLGDFVPALAVEGLGAPFDQYYSGVGDGTSEEDLLLGEFNTSERPAGSLSDVGGAVTVHEGSVSGFSGVADVSDEDMANAVLQ